ncbi:MULTISPECIES: RDD family protein [Tessaracoccus]|uniref:RDD family protein n=2 Tax=Tessaracoccus TaxID=72763 RepID=A0ABY8PZW6_9ACTN|nr:MULTISPECIES: RDD family protein [Tessaracoccus]WGT47988.1 RDD family protein [Tessaracoccus sp. T21]
MTQTHEDHDLYPGESLGLPQAGRGSLASWLARVGAMIGDWAASMVVAIALFGMDVMTGSGWKSFMILAVYFVQASLLTIFAGGSFGQLIARIGIVRVDGSPLGWWRPIVRTALKCLVIPALVVGAERRAITDLVLGTVVVNRR